MVLYVITTVEHQDDRTVLDGSSIQIKDLDYKVNNFSLIVLY